MAERAVMPVGNKLRTYFSKPANIITISFLFILVLTVVLPLGTLLIGSFKVNGNQEAIYIGGDVEDGDFTINHWKQLLIEILALRNKAINLIQHPDRFFLSGWDAYMEDLKKYLHFAKKPRMLPMKSLLLHELSKENPIAIFINAFPHLM